MTGGSVKTTVSFVIPNPVPNPSAEFTLSTSILSVQANLVDFEMIRVTVE
ncbi:MAG: hypothetical protein HYW01_04975 [Deltaproteobacteria bacterium]|nr:hypothetical protein [Deltaproteobacteria bacterium]